MQDERKPHTVPIADKWAGELCTLNGRRAKIVGRLNRFATIAVLEDMEFASQTLSAEWAWETVDLIMTNKNGRFTC